jgi:hypothetical protein
VEIAALIDEGRQGTNPTDAASVVESCKAHQFRHARYL